jgi:predicted AAA+ superfamily ATPase
MIKRTIFNIVLNSITPGKVVIVLGARRTGKTVLLKKISEEVKEPFLFLNGEDFSTIDLLERRTVNNYKTLLGNRKILFIDEAQKIPDIGMKLKLMVDEINDLKIIITGSSAFDIIGNTGEPLTGRKTTLKLFPLSEKELFDFESIIDQKDNLLKRLVYGNYPELYLLKNENEKALYLKELINSYLLKDILSLDNFKNSGKIINLLRLLAYQVGSEVSLNELARQLQLSRNTIEKYLDLLSKVFVLFKLEGFSRNLRKEISKSSKWYFYDNGIRNTLIANFNPLNLRNDSGQLWENYIISERMKYQEYNNMIVNNYFWRTYDQQEIDLIEEREGKLFAYEMKWNMGSSKLPAAWKKAYPDSEYKVISLQNYQEWVL